MMADFSPSLTVSEISRFIRERLGERDAVIAVSGGIDSAVVASLLQRSIPVEKIHAYFLPYKGTAKTDYDDVKSLSDELGLKIETIEITSAVDSFASLLKVTDRMLLGNIKSRTRMIISYYYSSVYGGLVVGTTNRSEYMTGYFTKFGDGACDIEPIMHLYKDEVRKIARYLRVPAHIIDKKPSAGLWESQTDEEEMGFTYDQLDSFLRSHPSPGSGFVPGNPTERRIFDMILKSEHKRHTPYSLMGREDV